MLEVGAGSGELAALLRDHGYDVVAIDPEGEAPVRPVALHELDEPAGSFDAAVAVVSLHHVEPLEESMRSLGLLVRPAGRLVVDEFDVSLFDERAARWLLEQHREFEGHVPDDPAALVAHLRSHLHPLSQIRDALGSWFELGPVTRGAYLHRWDLDPSLREAEESLIASGKLPATGARFVGRRHCGRPE